MPRPDRKLQATYTEEPPQDGERVVTLRRIGDVGLVGLLYHVPAASHVEFPAVELLGDILDSEPSGRLYKALVESKKATSVSVRPTAGHDPGAIEIIAEVNTKDLAALEKVRDVMISVVEEIARSGVTQQEVDRARQKVLKDRELAAADPNRIAIELSEWAAQGDWRLYFLNRDRIEQVTPAQVKEVAVKYFTTSNRTVGFFVPTAKRERTPIPAVTDVAKLLEGYTGRSDQGWFERSLRRLAPGHRGPAATARADRGRQTRLPAQEDARRVRPAAADPPLRQRRKPQRPGRGKRISARADDPRHQEPEPPADPGPAR